MAGKKIKLTLIYKGEGENEGRYLIAQIQNSVRWVPGQSLTKQDVKALADSPIEITVVGEKK